MSKLNKLSIFLGEILSTPETYRDYDTSDMTSKFSEEELELFYRFLFFTSEVKNKDYDSIIALFKGLPKWYCPAIKDIILQHFADRTNCSESYDEDLDAGNTFFNE